MIHSNSRENGGRDHAFTRVELLVVLLTLAMLSGLLLTTLARSDDNGARSVCTNNLRQMGMAVKMYAGDNTDYLPWPNWDGGTGWLYTGNGTDANGVAYAGIPNPGPIPPGPVARWPGDLAWKTGLLYHYVQNSKAYLCPVDIESTSYKNNQRANMLSSYLMNGASAGFPAPLQKFQYMTAKITQVWSPLCWLMWEPDEYLNVNGTHSAYPNLNEYNDASIYPVAPPNGSEGLGQLHTINGGEVLCVGGDVQFVTTAKFRADSNTPAGRGPGPGGKTYAWWSTFTIDGHF